MSVKSSILGPGSLKIGETASPTEWAGQLTKCIMKPSTETEDDIPVLSGELLDGEDTYTFTLGGTLMQDYELLSLEDYCFTNRGTKVPFVFTPSLTGKRSYSGIVKISPVDVGGDVKKRNTSDFEFRIIGDPTPGTVS